MSAIYTGINTGNPLAPNLAGAWTMQEGSGGIAGNLVTPGTYDGVLSENGNTSGHLPTWGPSTFACSGYGLTFNPTYAEVVSAGHITQLDGATAATIYVRFNMALHNNPLAVGRFVTNNFVFGILFNPDTDTYAICQTGSAQGYSQYLDVATLRQGNCSGCMTYGSSALKYYFNGTMLTPNTTAGTIPASIPVKSDAWTFGYDSTDNINANARVDLVLLWIGRTLTPTEVATLDSNPCSLLSTTKAVAYAF